MPFVKVPNRKKQPFIMTPHDISQKILDTFSSESMFSDMAKSNSPGGNSPGDKIVFKRNPKNVVNPNAVHKSSED